MNTKTDISFQTDAILDIQSVTPQEINSYANSQDLL